MRLLLCFFLALSFTFFACEPATQTNDAPDTETKDDTPPAPAQQFTLTPFTASQPFPDAKMESMELKNGKFTFGVSGTNYKLGDQTPDAEKKMCANSGKGQHIHLIVDNKPYAARYVAEFDDYEVEDGSHTILAFLSRSYHESIKTADAHMAQNVTVKDGSISEAKDVEGPMLFYSRPKGTYTGKKDTEKIMLDFYLSNITLGADYRVKAEINGEEHVITEWQPYYIEGLPMGENKVKLTLLDKDGKQVDVPLNPVERTFTLKADPVEG